MCCLITHSIMKKSIDELSDEEFVQQLIAKLENLKAEADFVYSPPPLPGKEERYYESYISWAENFIDDYDGIMACEAPQRSPETVEEQKHDIQYHLHKLIDEVMNVNDYDSVLAIRTLLEHFNRMDEHIIEEELSRVDEHLNSLDEYRKFKQAKLLDTKKVTDVQFAHAIDVLLLEIDNKGRYIFESKSHWIAVFRVAADMHLIGDNDYQGFDNWIHRIHPKQLRIDFTSKTLKPMTTHCYFLPFDKWEFQPMKNETKRPYDKMVTVVVRLKKLLEQKKSKKLALSFNPKNNLITHKITQWLLSWRLQK